MYVKFLKNGLLLHVFHPICLMMKPYETSSKESTQARERKKNKGQGPKSRQANNPKEVCHMNVKEPLSTETSTSCIKHIS